MLAIVKNGSSHRFVRRELVARNPKEALSIFAEHQPGVVIEAKVSEGASIAAPSPPVIDEDLVRHNLGRLMEAIANQSSSQAQPEYFDWSYLLFQP